MTGKNFMYNIAQFSYKSADPDHIELAAECRKGFDLSLVKSKSKAAGAFALWVDGICSIRRVHDEKLPKLQVLQAGANEATEQFNIKKEELNAFQLEIQQEGTVCNEKAKELMAIKEKMEQISQLKFS